MKKLILVIAAFSFAAIVSAQSASSVPPATSATKSSATTANPNAAAHAQVWYGCPKCDFTSQKDGKCPKDGSALLKDHSYFCPKCNMTSGAAGKCTHDGADLVMVNCKAKMMDARKTATPPVHAISK